MVVEKKLYTVDELEEFIARPENRDRSFELIHGEIVEKAMPTQEHGIIALNFGSEMRVFTKAHNLGRVGVEVLYRMPEDEHNARQPDISFYADISMPVVRKGAMPRMPDLAVEIKSTDSSAT